MLRYARNDDLTKRISPEPAARTLDDGPRDLPAGSPSSGMRLQQVGSMMAARSPKSPQATRSEPSREARSGNRRGIRPCRLSRQTVSGYLIQVTILADARPLRRAAACLMLGSFVLHANAAAAQGISPVDGFASLPSFAWSQPAGREGSRWAGSYAQISTGFEVASSKHFGSYAGPTIGFEGGRMWQEGGLVYGVLGGFDYLDAMGASTFRYGRFGHPSAFSGALQVKVGTLLTPVVMLYTKAGAVATHERSLFGATSFPPPFTRDDIVVRPDARAGIEWAVTDRLSVSVEAGVAGRGARW